MQSELKKKGEFVYSDLGFILLGKIVERLSGMRVDQYAQTYFYEPMRLKRTLFNPSRKFYHNEIAPSTNDNYFRHQKIQGFVHDPAAAMLGGVAGHAGLFSNAHELGKIMQMLNNGGILDGKQYFKQETVALFVTAQKGTHRGLGFDKPNGLTQGKANVSEMVPPLLFGHSGFTGNWAWADPKNDLIFIFLSNRTYPDEANKKLIQENVRTKAIEIVYKALRP
jgi:CubicO group peptidase (beta-lactamase class C family)